MRKLLTSVLSLLIIAAALYSGVWYFVAQKMKQNLESHIAGFSSHQDDPTRVFSYDSIKLSGYPFNIEFSISQPKIALTFSDKVPMSEEEEEPYSEDSDEPYDTMGHSDEQFEPEFDQSGERVQLQTEHVLLSSDPQTGERFDIQMPVKSKDQMNQGDNAAPGHSAVTSGESPTLPMDQPIVNTPADPRGVTDENLMANEPNIDSNDSEPQAEELMLSEGDSSSVISGTNAQNTRISALEFSSKGHFVIGSNILMNKQWGELTGTIAVNLTDQSGSIHQYALEQSTSPMRVETHFKDTILINALLSPSFAIFNNRQLIQQLNSVQTHAGKFTMRDITNNALLFTMDKEEWHYNNNATNAEVIGINLGVVLENFEATPEFDQLFFMIAELTRLDELPAFQLLVSENIPYGLHPFGSLSAAFDITLSAPRNLVSISENIAAGDVQIDSITSLLTKPLSFRVNTFKISNALETISATGNISLSRDKNAPNALYPNVQAILDITSSFTENWYHYQIQKLSDTFELSSKLSKMENIETTGPASLLSLTENPGAAAAIIPKLHETGDLRYLLDIDIKPTENKYSINNYEVRIGKFSTKVSGSAMASDDSKLPPPFSFEGQFDVTLTHYKEQIAQLLGYLRRVNSTMTQNQKSLMPVILSEAFESDLIIALKTISNEPEADHNNLVISLKSNKDQMFPTIGTLPFFEAFAKLQQILEPHVTGNVIQDEPAESSELVPQSSDNNGKNDEPRDIPTIEGEAEPSMPKESPTTPLAAPNKAP